MTAGRQAVGRTLGRLAAARLAGLLLLAGCATPPPAPTSPPERVTVGRFSVTAIAGSQNASTAGRFTLATRGRQLTLDLATPLGATLARIEVGPGGAHVVSTAEGGGARELRGADAESLTAQMFGWTLPVSGLPDWVMGRPTPGRPVQYGDSGAAGANTAAAAATRGGLPGSDVFIQDGWRVEMHDRRDDGQPRRVDLTRGPSGTQPALRLRLAIEAEGDASAGTGK